MHNAEKNEEHIGRFKLFLHRGINNFHEFSCTLCTTLLNMQAICEGLVGF